MPLELPILDRSKSPAPLSVLLMGIRSQLLAMDETQSLLFFSPLKFDRLLKTTVSLCSDCLRHVPALVYTLDGRVLLRKRCPDHGLADALLESDENFFYLSNKDRWGRRFADDKCLPFPRFSGASCCQDSGSCGSETGNGDDGNFTDQMGNKSCTVLVEVTNACNLACPVCYSDAKGDRKMPFKLFKRYMLRLIEKKGGLDSIQLTGGEALLHSEFWEMLEFLFQQDGVKRIYLPTNGILLAKPVLAQRLAPFKKKLMVLLQFDGRSVEANDSIRAANTVRLRQQVIENLEKLAIYMQLTMTIAQGVNDDDVGWVVDTALQRSVVKVAALQPVTYSGRYDLQQDPMTRLTLSDVIKAVQAQASRRMDSNCFAPIPCSHPNCGWVTLFARRFGATFNIMKHIDLPRAMNEAAYKTILSTREIRGLVDGGAGLAQRFLAAVGRKIIRASDVVGIAVKPFMDRYNYDQDRVSACCHHLLDTKGNPISFCEYNARLRMGDSWEAFPQIGELPP